MSAFKDPVTTEAELRELMGTPSAGAVAKDTIFGPGLIEIN